MPEKGTYSKSAWKSLVVKGLRLGWPAGLRQAEKEIGKSEVKRLLELCVWEDVFPPEAELNDTFDEIKRGDYEALCSRETWHARGEYTAEGLKLSPRSRNLWEEGHEDDLALAYTAARRIGRWVPDFGLANFFAWVEIAPSDVGARRSVDATPWPGRMPDAILDDHTIEGRRRKTRKTLLSGHYETHRRLSTLVSEYGWCFVRDIVHSRCPEDWGT